LAPGLITSIGAVLVDHLQNQHGKVETLELRVGALPQFSNHPASYAFTWSSLGLANEYINDCEVIENGTTKLVPPLDQLEKLVINGTQYEAFTTSGGMGPASMYSVPNVNYKTIRYPGHHAWLTQEHGPLHTASLVTGVPSDTSVPEMKQKFLAQLAEIFEREFKHTRQDAVVVFARAASSKREISYSHTFKPDSDAYTALEITTAGTGVACLEYIDFLERNDVKGRTIFGGQVSYADLINTAVGRSFLERIEL
jgi:hypothetical protein